MSTTKIVDKIISSSPRTIDFYQISLSNTESGNTCSTRARKLSRQRYKRLAVLRSQKQGRGISILRTCKRQMCISWVLDGLERRQHIFCHRRHTSLCWSCAVNSAVHRLKVTEGHRWTREIFTDTNVFVDNRQLCHRYTAMGQTRVS